MMRSMFSGVSGLRVHQTKMDVLANNIANVNTVGFKSSRVTFNEVFYQTVSGASGASETTGRGGVNPMQIGLGSSVSSIDLQMSTGPGQRTDNPFDLMIEGDGFFILGDNSGTYFSRAGALNLDKEGNLVGAGGLKVMGWDTVPDPENPGQMTIQKGKVEPIEITGEKESTSPTTTKNIHFNGNLNAKTDPIKDSTVAFYDSVGNRYVADVKFTYTSANTWNYEVSDVIVDGVVMVTCAANGTITFDTNGKPKTVTPALTVDGVNVLGGEVTATGGPGQVPVATFGDANSKFVIDFSRMTQYGEKNSDAKAETKDGNEEGKLNRINIGTDGKIIGSYTNGQTKLIGQIATAKFKNPAGLEKIGSNLFVTTINSGDFNGIGEEVQSSGGKMLGGMLEMSNVDLSSEFTEMITTQRGFQANSRVITTSDDMLQELVNLKR